MSRSYISPRLFEYFGSHIHEFVLRGLSATFCMKCILSTACHEVRTCVGAFLDSITPYAIYLWQFAPSALLDKVGGFIPPGLGLCFHSNLPACLLAYVTLPRIILNALYAFFGPEELLRVVELFLVLLLKIRWHGKELLAL